MASGQILERKGVVLLRTFSDKTVYLTIAGKLGDKHGASLIVLLQPTKHWEYWSDLLDQISRAVNETLEGDGLLPALLELRTAEDGDDEFTQRVERWVADELQNRFGDAAAGPGCMTCGCVLDSDAHRAMCSASIMTDEPVRPCAVCREGLLVRSGVLVSCTKCGAEGEVTEGICGKDGCQGKIVEHGGGRICFTCGQTHGFGTLAAPKCPLCERGFIRLVNASSVSCDACGISGITLDAKCKRDAHKLYGLLADRKTYCPNCGEVDSTTPEPLP